MEDDEKLVAKALAQYENRLLYAKAYAEAMRVLARKYRSEFNAILKELLVKGR